MLEIHNFFMHGFMHFRRRGAVPVTAGDRSEIEQHKQEQAPGGDAPGRQGYVAGFNLQAVRFGADADTFRAALALRAQNAVRRMYLQA